jgi:hypothetical protein
MVMGQANSDSIGRTAWSAKARAPRVSATAKKEAKLRAVVAEDRRAAWARRHPKLAAEERAFRKGRAELLGRWDHKRNGTPETHDHASRTRQGAIARLHLSGAIDDDQLAWSTEIAMVAEAIGADVSVRTASLETRVDRSPHGKAFYERLGWVWMEAGYSRWRAETGIWSALVLDIIVHDMGVTIAARLHGVHVRRARRELVAALERWDRCYWSARNAIDEGDLIAAHAGLL